MTGKITTLRSIAYSHQAGRCYYCNMLMWTKSPNEFASKYGITEMQAKRHQCTAENLQARKDGGETSPSNIVAACKLCNQRRHKRKNPPVPECYRELVQRRIKQKKWHEPWVFEKRLYTN